MTSTQSHPSNMRAFITIWTTQLISILGSGLTSFAMAVWIFDQTGQATPFALTVLFGTLPRLLLSPLAGSVADRYSRKTIMLLADTGAALITLSLFLLLSAGVLQVWLLYILVAAGSCLGAFQEPAYTASITMLVPKDQLPRASGLGQLSNALESLIAPALAGFLFVTIGFNSIVLIDFITYFFALAGLLLVPIPQPAYQSPPEAEKSTGPAWLADFRFGWGYLAQRRGLFGLLLFFALVNFLLNLSAVLLGPLMLSRFSAREYGLVQMAMGLGTLAGSLLLGAWGGPKQGRVPWIIGAIALSACGLAFAGLFPHPLWIGLGMLILILPIPLGSGLSQALFQTKIAPAIQGRVFAVRAMISRGIMPVAFLIAGPLADHIFEPLMQPEGALGLSWIGQIFGSGPGRGIGLLFTLSGLLLLLACGAAFISPTLRSTEDDTPDAI